MRNHILTTCILLLSPTVCLAQSPADLLERCRQMNFDLEGEQFDFGWQQRVLLEFTVVTKSKPEALNLWLADDNPYVRAMAARALGIQGDKQSADALAELAKNDPEYVVRIRAVEALGLLKLKPKVIEQAKDDKHGGVRWVAGLSADMLKQKQDFAAQVRKAFAEGIKQEEMAQAVVGKRAPEFTALTLEGKTFKLSRVLGKKPVVIYFAAMDS